MIRSAILFIAAALLASTPQASLAADTKVLSFSTTFREPVTPTGGVGKWRSRFDWGRWQAGNKELAPYCDATTDLGAHPHPMVAGRRVLRTEKKPSRDSGRTFAFCAPMITTQGWRSFKYGYFQLTATVCPKAGIVPAFWMLPADGSWPPEIDVFEFGLLANEPAGTLRGNVHTKTLAGAHLQDSHVLRFVANCKQHVFGFNWTPKIMEWRVDDVLLDSRPNVINQPMYLVMNTAVGLMSHGPVRTGPNWHNDFTLSSLKVWQEPGTFSTGAK